MNYQHTRIIVTLNKLPKYNTSTPKLLQVLKVRRSEAKPLNFSSIILCHPTTRMNLFCFLNMNKNMSKSKFTSRQKLVKMQLVTYTAQNGFGVTEEPFELLLDGSSVISSGSSSSSPYSISLIKVSGMLSGFGVVRTTF